MRAFVIHRDRPTYLIRCVQALQRAGVTTIHVVDHASSWPGAVELLEDWASADPATSGIRVHRHGDDHPRDLWAPGGVIERTVGTDERFIVTDCDVIPDEGCPADWLDRLSGVLDRVPVLRKVGLSLRTDDLPAHYPHRVRVQQWEVQFSGGAPTIVVDGVRAHLASIDTTMALYRGRGPFRLDPSARLAVPYQARHLSWYEDPDDLLPELAHYRAHVVPGISHWSDPDGFVGDHALGGH